ncbi:MAG: chitobiase/beta-hexosaminidase C-terminal domain-containing protein [Lachnospiraceae bacterium]|nr:chitobiase/beta-hexosaminidase C-terminal domain-containing protein [Lachnospiraceae bacterium]
MKKCSNCGASLPDDELFCPRCGEEVQLVPIFETVESSIKEQQRILEEKEREKQAILAMEEEERENKKKKRNTVMISVGVVAFVLIALIGGSFLLRTSRKSAFNSKYTKAVEAYNAADYDSSLELITLALEKDPGNLEGKILMADIYAAQGKTDVSSALYLEVIDENPDSESAYRKLIGMYEVLGQGKNIHSLLNNCTSQEILDKFADYIVEAPSLSVNAGTYDVIKELELASPAGNQIRYTLDGSEPSLLSLLYNDKIVLNGGKTKVRAACFNNKGIPSEIIEAEYEIKVESVDSPVIFPRGTSFTYNDGKTHKFTIIVPRGMKALYAYDSMPTAESPVYKEPVDMLEGNHSFYAILINKKTGGVSSPTSITYSYGETNVQDNISIVQDADGNLNASYSDGSDYTPPAQEYYEPSYDDTPSDNGGGGGGWTPDPGPAPNPPGGGGGGGNVTPDPGPNPPGGGGGGEVTPDPGDGGGGGGEVTPDPGDGGGGGGEVTPDPGDGGGGGEVTPDPGDGGGGGEVTPDPEPVAEMNEA